MSLLLLKTFLQLLPQLIGLVKIAALRIKQGHDIEEIHRAFERIEDAFKQENRAEGAKKLNDLWNGSKPE